MASSTDVASGATATVNGRKVTTDCTTRLSDHLGPHGMPVYQTYCSTSTVPAAPEQAADAQVGALVIVLMVAAVVALGLVWAWRRAATPR